MFGLSVDHARRLYDAMPPTGLPLCDNWGRMGEEATKPIRYSELISSGQWKNWRRDLQSGRYVLDRECVVDLHLSCSYGFDTEEMRKLREE